MPTLEHEYLVQLFRNRPALAAELAEVALGLVVPDFDRASADSIDFVDIDPAECRSDHVTVLERGGRAVFAFAVEIQRGIKASKTYIWPVFGTSLRRRHQCPTVVLVLATTDAVARWAAQPIDLGGGNQYRVCVVGPNGVPVIDETRAQSSPELGVLAALAHGNDPDTERATRLALMAFAAIAGLPADQLELYSDMITAGLSEAARKRIAMLPEGFQYQSELARTSQARGEARGEARGKAEAILEALEVRGLAVTDEQRRRITATTDLDLLRRWLRKAITVATADEVFAE